ncbi:MAG TPA: DUF4013 domain-containing protein [Methanocorpusculum sp.]|nr:DUF4013 domain-containing protein [Methanocorpusculum sp.]HJJ81447.1 DUF4013 domain-containing protein [Methanocorpusculum sp.]
MSISFGDNIDKSFAYANGAFKKFSGWFILIILSMLVYGSTFAMVFAMIALLVGILMTLPTDVVGASFVTSSDAVVAVSPGMVETMSYTAGTDIILSGLFIGGMLAVILVSSLVMLIASFFMSGFILRVYRGEEELNFKNLGKMFWQGVVYFVIMFIYFIPYSIVSELLMYGPIWNTGYLIIISCINIFLCIFSTVLAINAGIRYAKEGRFGAAFHLGKICSIVGNIGWLRYLGHIILFMIIIRAVELIFMMVPFVGILLLIVALPFIMIFQAKFLTNLYESGEALEEPAEVPAVVE